jgi:hypothetical protein
LDKKWKEAVVVYFKAVLQYLPGQPDENHDNPGQDSFLRQGRCSTSSQITEGLNVVRYEDDHEW